MAICNTLTEILVRQMKRFGIRILIIFYQKIAGTVTIPAIFISKTILIIHHFAKLIFIVYLPRKVIIIVYFMPKRKPVVYIRGVNLCRISQK